jgi:SMC interacting uncharacterized protein involved in chromosome segregation
MSNYETMMLIFAGVSAVGMPAVLLVLNRMWATRDKHQQEQRDRYAHLDECFDSLKAIVLAKTVTRDDIGILRADIKADLSNFRAEFNETLTRVRAAISTETDGLHQRLMRIEAPFFERQQQ